MKVGSLVKVIPVVLAIACGRTGLENPALDAVGGASNGARSGMGGTSSAGRGNAGRGGTLSAGMGGQATGGNSAAGQGGMAGMSPVVCGDGIVSRGEDCEPGFEPAAAALELRQGALRQPVEPIVGSASANVYYSYDSLSSHTGFESLGASRLYLYRWNVESAMSLVMHHGIDQDSSGITQPESRVVFEITGLPDTGVVAVSDDNLEFVRTTPSTARADWTFRRNSDGGVIAGLPFPGTWHLTISPGFLLGVTEWAFLSGTDGMDPGSAVEVSLDPSQPVELVASDRPGACRPDCTIPRCGDGRLDPGEVCDDANEQPGDGCFRCRPEL